MMLENCSAEDIHLTGYQAGGLVGQLVGGRGCKFTNCWTADVEVRMTSSLYASASGFIGSINNGAGSALVDCKAPTRVVYLDDKTGEVKTNYWGELYEPENEFYGSCGGTDIVIETTTGTTEP